MKSRTPATSAPSSAGSGMPRPPRNAPVVVAPLSTMAATAPTEAPLVMPRTSGEASGLRAKVWNSAPATPEREPDQRADGDPRRAELQRR